jgi:hypothetical protein
MSGRRRSTFGAGRVRRKSLDAEVMKEVAEVSEGLDGLRRPRRSGLRCLGATSCRMGIRLVPGR